MKANKIDGIECLNLLRVLVPEKRHANMMTENKTLLLFQLFSLRPEDLVKHSFFPDLNSDVFHANKQYL